MTKQLEQAIKAIEELPADRQDEIAESLVIAIERSRIRYSDAQILASREGLAQANSGKFISDKKLCDLLGYQPKA